MREQIGEYIEQLKERQKGRYSSRERALAITKLQEAVFWLDQAAYEPETELLDRHEHKIDKDPPDSFEHKELRSDPIYGRCDDMDYVPLGANLESVAELAKRTAREDGPTTSERPQPGPDDYVPAIADLMAQLSALLTQEKVLTEADMHQIDELKECLRLLGVEPDLPGSDADADVEPTVADIARALDERDEPEDD